MNAFKMGTNRLRRRLLRGWLLMFLLGMISTSARGQVIIRERMELDRVALTPQAAHMETTVQPPLQSDLLIPVEFDQLLALADGTLLVDFTEAFADQSVDFSAEPLVVEILRQGETLRHELFPADYLPDPLTISTAGSLCQDQIYSAEPYLYSRITDNAVISRFVIRPPFPSDISDDAEANPLLLSVSKTVDSDPDFFFSDEERSLLWLPALQTNGLVEHAELVLRPSLNTIQPVVDPEGASFPMLLYRATSPWTPEQVKWDSQPGVSDLVTVEESDLDVEQVEVTVDITSIGQFWVANPEQVHGLALYPEQFSGNGSIFSLFKRSSRVNIELANPNPPADSLSRQIPLQAGDVVKFFFRERNLHNGFFEYETDGYGILFEQSGLCRRLEMNLRAGLEPTGPPPAIAIRPEPDTLAAGEQSLIGLEIAFSNGIKRPFPFQQRFDLELLSGQELGVLRAADSGQTGSSLQQVSGKVWFDAFPDIPQAGQTVQIGAAALLEPYGEISIGAAPDDGTLQMQTAQAASPAAPEVSLSMDTESSPAGIELTGSGEITIQGTEIDLTMEITGPSEIWPTLPEGSVQRAFNRNLIENSTRLFVSTTSDEMPIAGQTVQISAEWLAESGGHNHNGSGLKTPPDSLMGIFQNLSTGETSAGAILAVTDTTGTIQLEYESPVFGGEVDITAGLPGTGQSIEASRRLDVRVPGLGLLPDFERYEKVGGVPNHHGPRLDDLHPGNRTPDNNHWVNETVGQLLIALAAVYNDRFPDREKIRFNDISLPNGGRFDINGRWNGNRNHALHRLGFNVDV